MQSPVSNMFAIFVLAFIPSCYSNNLLHNINLVGGTVHTDIQTSDRDGSLYYNVSATIDKEDLGFIIDNEVYAKIMIFSCDNDALKYPADILVSGTYLDDFNRSRRIFNETANQGQHYRVSGHIPANVALRIGRPCAKLIGGSYSGVEIDSNIVQLSSN